MLESWVDVAHFRNIVGELAVFVGGFRNNVVQFAGNVGEPQRCCTLSQPI